MTCVANAIRVILIPYQQYNFNFYEGKQTMDAEINPNNEKNDLNPNNNKEDVTADKKDEKSQVSAPNKKTGTSIDKKALSGKKDDTTNQEDEERIKKSLKKYLTCIEPYPSYYIEDVFNFDKDKKIDKLEYLFILESPYIEEVEKGYPLAGDSGKSVSKMLLDVDGEAFGKIIKSKGKDNINSPKICVMNVSQVPLEVNPEAWKEKEIPAFKSLKEATNGLYSKLECIRTQKIYNKRDKYDETILEQFCERLDKYIIDGNKNLCIVLCGKFAQVYFDCAKEKCNKLKTKIDSLEEKNILYLPHPSYNQWEKINEYYDNFDTLMRSFAKFSFSNKNKEKVKCKTSKSYKLKKGVTMKKILSNWLFWLAIGLFVLFAANLAYGIWGCNDNDNSKSNYLTIISGWISGLATLSVGIIAYTQAQKYKKQEIATKKYADIIVECILLPYTAGVVPKNKLGRKCSIIKNNDYEYENLCLLVYN